ncbi:MAG: TetR/AcrR family transcriptional regulator [Geminicoccaceae bacterium]
MPEKKNRAESAQARRRLIVDAAIACFIDKGFHQTSIRDIAKRAGVSLGNVYNHFENKNALIAEIATYEAEDIEEIEREIAKSTDPIDALDRFAALHAGQYCQPGVPLLIAEIISEGLRNPEIGTGFSQNRARLVSSITSLVQKISESDDSPTDLSHRDCAEFILDLVEGLAMRCAFEGRELKATDLTLLKKGIRRLLGVEKFR